MSIDKPKRENYYHGCKLTWVVECEGPGTGWKREGAPFGSEAAAKKRVVKLRVRYHWSGKNFRVRDLSATAEDG